MRKLFLSFLFSLVFALVPTAMAQDSLAYVIRGLVVDAQNGKRIPDAQIHLPQSTISTMTNADGRFSLKLAAMPEQLAISMMGYHTTTITREELLKSQPQVKGEAPKEIRILLEAEPKYLKEIYVYSPINILNTAISKIKDNFTTTPQQYEAFYRETIRKRNNYVSVTEAVMQLYKTSYESGHANYDLTHLLKGRSLMSQKAKDTLSVHVQGGPTEAINVDLVKNRSLFLCKEMLERYAFEFETPQHIDGRSQCVIAFKPNVTCEEPLFRGRIFIDYESLTFTRIEYNIDMSDPDKVANVILAKKPRGMRFTPKALDIVMNYYYDGQKSHLNYMKTTYRFNCDWKKRGIATPYVAVSEMLVTSYGEAMTRASYRGAFHNNDVLSKEVQDFSDPDFWSDYNILMPSESLEHAVKKLKKTHL